MSKEIFIKTLTFINTFFRSLACPEETGMTGLASRAFLHVSQWFLKELAYIMSYLIL